MDAVLEQVRRGRVTIGDGGAAHVDETGPARVETAYLQLVMKRLWDEEIAAGSQRLRLETLRRLGGADTIVRGHLDDVMDKLPADQRDAAAEAFRFLVTSGGRKIALSSEELREFSDVAAARWNPRSSTSSASASCGRSRPRSRAASPATRSTTTSSHPRSSTGAGATPRSRDTSARAGREGRRLEVRNRRLAAAVIALAAVAVALALYLWDPSRYSDSSCGRSTPDSRCAGRARPTRASS